MFTKFFPNTFLFILFLFFPVIPVFTWGFFAHKKINQLAVFTLPPEMVTFYKTNIDYLTMHATDADRRRKVVEEEACRHYIDMDHYGLHPFDSLPKFWKDAVAKFSEDSVKSYGIVPWYVEKMMFRLTEAFKEKNVSEILYLSSNIGHYIADACVPLHTTENYNGQLTNQVGIHGFWESRIPELFFDDWNFFVGRAYYIKNVNSEIWRIVNSSFVAKDSVLKFEAALSQSWSSDNKYVMHKKKKVYTEEYAKAYNEKLHGMVEKRMRLAVLTVGNFWYTAWVNAGQPDLSKLKSADGKEAADEKNKQDTLYKILVGHNDD